MNWRAWFLFTGLLLFSSGSAGAVHEIKLATLAPLGSTWMNIVEDWAAEIEKRSDGRLRLKIYPGGVAGDEPDVLRKIRFGQLHGGIFSGYGVGRIYSPARVLEMPFLFESVEEIDYVREQLMPDIEKGFQANGYQLLGWMEVGFIRFFSRTPIHSIDDLKKRRIWLWQGDPLAEAFFKATGLSPIPLSIIDVFTSLSTGLVDTVYSTPLAALAMQWFTKTEYVTDIPMANGIGALVVSTRAYSRLPKDLQLLLKETGQAVGERLIFETRRDNKKSLDVLRNYGLKFVMTPDEVDWKEMEDIRDRASAALQQSGYLPTELVTRTNTLISEYRSRKQQVTESR